MPTSTTEYNPVRTGHYEIRIKEQIGENGWHGSMNLRSPAQNLAKPG